MSRRQSEEDKERGKPPVASRSDHHHSPEPDPLSKVLPNPLSDTTTATSEGPRPAINNDIHDTQSNHFEEEKYPPAGEQGLPPSRGTGTNRIDDSWDSNRLTLNMDQNNHTGSNTSTFATSFKKLNTHGLTQAQAEARQRGLDHDWEATWEKERLAKRQAKVREDLKGWRGGNGTPRSNYCPTAFPPDSYFGTPVTGTIGLDLPKEVLRIERDWSTGEVCQFETTFPIELERRVTPAQFQSLINTINIHLVSAYSTRAAIIDNLIAISTWWTSLLFRTGHFEKELRVVEGVIEAANKEVFNPAGLNVLSPRLVALQFLEIEYY